MILISGTELPVDTKKIASGTPITTYPFYPSIKGTSKFLNP
jgi:hypothetical protein